MEYWRTPKGQEARRKYYDSEEGLAARLKSYHKNKDKIYERNRIARQTGKYKAAMKAYAEIYYRDPVKRIHKLCLGARIRAKKDGIEFDACIFVELKSNIPSICACCGGEILFSNTKYGPSNPSLDRVDSSRGYISGNVHIICWRCNILKADGSIRDFENILAYMKARIQ